MLQLRHIAYFYRRVKQSTITFLTLIITKMKKLITILAISIATITANAQITLESSYTSMPKVIHLSSSGYKYCVIGDTTRLYNLNHSLWKTINLVIPAGWGGVFDYISVSDMLFNSDTLVEVLYLTNTNYQVARTYVINETGSILFQLGSSYGYFPQITNDGTNFKLVAYDSVSSKYNVYGLPGTLPCDLCGGTVGIPVHNSDGSKEMISNPYPNPTNDKTTINYELPEGINQGKIAFYDIMGNYVKGFMVDRTFKDLQISNADLAAGTYYYQLQTSKGMSGGKKLMVIK